MLRIGVPDGLQPSFYSIWRSAFRKEGCREPQPATFHVKHTPEPASGSRFPAARRSPRPPPPSAAPRPRSDRERPRRTVEPGRLAKPPPVLRTECPEQMLAPAVSRETPAAAAEVRPGTRRPAGAGAGVPRHLIIAARGRIKAEPRVGIILAAPPPMPDRQGLPKMGHGGPASPRRFLGEGPAQRDHRGRAGSVSAGRVSGG